MKLIVAENGRRQNQGTYPRQEGIRGFSYLLEESARCEARVAQKGTRRLSGFSHIGRMEKSVIWGDVDVVRVRRTLGLQ